MKTANTRNKAPSAWRISLGEYDLPLTQEHIDRSIRAHARLLGNRDVRHLSVDSVMHGAAVCAAVATFRRDSGDLKLLALLVANELGSDPEGLIGSIDSLIEPAETMAEFEEYEASELERAAIEGFSRGLANDNPLLLKMA